MWHVGTTLLPCLVMLYLRKEVLRHGGKKGRGSTKMNFSQLRERSVWWADKRDAGTRGMKRAESEGWASDTQYANRHAEVSLLYFRLHAPLGSAHSSGAPLAVPVNIDIRLNHLRCGKRMTMGTSGRL